MDRVFDFPEVPPAASRKADIEPSPVLTFKGKFTFVIFLITVVVLSTNRMNMGVVTWTAGAILILSGCCSSKEAVDAVPWTVVIMMACMIGFASVIDSSGAGQVIGNVLVGIGDRLHFGPIGYCFLIAVLGQLVSNFMSNNAAVVIVIPIAIATTKMTGINPYLLIMVGAFHVNASILTPLANPLMSVTLQAGFRFRDYFKANWLIAVPTLILTTLFAYYLWG